MTPRDYLAGLEFHGIKLGLDNIRLLAEAAGQPQNRFASIHVAGTNGKGSVVAFLDAILRAAGYRVGRFTSPHLIDVNERFLLDAAPIPDAELDAHIEFFRDVAAGMDHSPTYFEVATAVAFRYFAERRVDLGLIEVGMGGRFDATNIVSPLISVITNIALEHTRYLGDTLEKIAFEKAGIIKERTPVVSAETESGPIAVIESQAKTLGSPVYLLGRDFRYSFEAGQFAYDGPGGSVGPVRLGLPGSYQGVNAATAVTVIRLVRDRLPGADDPAIARGLACARWPCRLEQVLDAPPVIIDVAHNPAGARQLAKELRDCVVVLAVASDKDAAAMIDALAPTASHLILTRFAGRRAMPLDTLCGAAGSRPSTRTETLAEAIELGIRLASPQCPLVITGSNFTAGEARRILTNSYGASGLAF